MSTISNAYRPGGAHQPHGQRLWCAKCRTDDHLIIESMDALKPPETGMVQVSYTCVECDFFYAHAAAVPQVEAILNRPGPGAASGVLEFGGEYIHCGEPMHTAGSELRSIYAPVTTEQSGEGVLDVYLRTRVLRCGCGFQMEIPV
ncbi:hypothetical protein [Pseudarthrobacter sp. N5]|uniref:hypothetical protein n=1 Tax=Pseudarthrobacter sp. N5 TaxID=3418416 RepID=UPI003CFA8AE9